MYLYKFQAINIFSYAITINWEICHTTLYELCLWCWQKIILSILNVSYYSWLAIKRQMEIKILLSRSGNLKPNNHEKILKLRSYLLHCAFFGCRSKFGIHWFGQKSKHLGILVWIGNLCRIFVNCKLKNVSFVWLKIYTGTVFL